MGKEKFSEPSAEAAMLMAQLNTEGKELAVEYISYLVSTGKYPAKDNHKEHTIILVPISNIALMA